MQEEIQVSIAAWISSKRGGSIRPQPDKFFSFVGRIGGGVQLYDRNRFRW